MRAITRYQCYTILYLTFLTLFPIIVISTYTINATQSLTNNQTLVSADNVFELGFFSPGNSGKWYVGMWYKNIPDKTYVWVANRDNPLTNSSGIFKISNQSIVLLDQAENLVWSSNQTEAINPIVELLDTGNLVIREENNNDKYLWQSFDYPTDTLLADMKLGWNLDTGLDRYLSSWRSTDDPSTGDFSAKLNFHGLIELFLWNNQQIKYRSGPWNGLRFSGIPEMKPQIDHISFNIVSNRDEVYYSFEILNKYMISRLTVNPSGMFQHFAWIDESQKWNPFWYAPKDQCDNYRQCGPFGICDTNALPVCKCTKGFEPKNLQNWILRDGSDGCSRRTNLECMGDKFLHLKNMKLPDTTSSFVDKNMTLKNCEAFCLGNCSCTAYASWDITNGGTGCIIWVGELLDMRQYAEDGQDLYFRLAASDLDKTRHKITIIIIIAMILGTITFAICTFLSGRWMAKHRGSRSAWKEKSEVMLSLDQGEAYSKNSDHNSVGGRSHQINLKELSLLKFEELATATNNFHPENKLGQGGFGPVYRGKLENGQEIAVKRLSRASGQGPEEFMNEVLVISKLQHRNLVRLLGCCVDGEEKLLVYEYMPNKSLDTFLFDSLKQEILNWRTRSNIIEGIARGLLYLHRDSRLKVIHRDLKASNILLDEELNPKISDFGMARIFGGTEDQANTKRVVGTYGYMSPEYAMEGRFSQKSDIFSFGVLLLEIVSGRKNTSFYNDEQALSLIGYAWKLWNEDNIVAIVDPLMYEPCFEMEILRCIHVGLLCVQEFSKERPTVSDVISMLNSEIKDLSAPKQPAFTDREFASVTESSEQRQQRFSINNVTITIAEGR